MMVDYRIYSTIYALLLAAYVGSCVIGLITIDSPRSQTICQRLWGGSCVALALVGLGNYLDWLWS